MKFLLDETFPPAVADGLRRVVGRLVAALSEAAEAERPEPGVVMWLQPTSR